MLSPKQDVEDARVLRKDLEYNMLLRYEAEDRGESSADYIDKVK